jgi:hypothetical protein
MVVVMVVMVVMMVMVVPSPPNPCTPPSLLAHLRFIPTRNDLFVCAIIPATNKQTAKKTKKVKGESKGAKRVGWLAALLTD